MYLLSFLLLVLSSYFLFDCVWSLQLLEAQKQRLTKQEDPPKQESDDKETDRTETDQVKKRPVMEPRVMTVTWDTDHSYTGINLYIRIGGGGMVKVAPPKQNYTSAVCFELEKSVDVSDLKLDEVDVFSITGDIENFLKGASIKFGELEEGQFRQIGTKKFSCLTPDDPVILLRIDRGYVINTAVATVTYSTDVLTSIREIELPFKEETTTQSTFFKTLGLSKLLRYLTHKRRANLTPTPNHTPSPTPTASPDPNPKPEGVGIVFIVSTFFKFDGTQEVYPGTVDDYPTVMTVQTKQIMKDLVFRKSDF